MQQISVDQAQHAGRRDPLSYDLSVPDLRGTGAVLCVEAHAGWNASKHCGIAPGETVSLTSTPPPVFSVPPNATVLTRTTRFAWQGSGHGVYALRFDVWSPTPSQPTVTLYTADRSAAFPILPRSEWGSRH